MLCQFVFFFVAHRRLKKKQPSYIRREDNLNYVEMQIIYCWMHAVNCVLIYKILHAF